MFCIGEHRPGLLDVAFLLLRASFYATFLKNSGRAESLSTTTCLMTMVGVRQRHDRCRILSLQHRNFMVIVILSHVEVCLAALSVSYGQEFRYPFNLMRFFKSLFHLHIDLTLTV